MSAYQTTFLRSQQQRLAEEIVAQQYRRQTELWQTYGERGRQISVRDAGYHLAYLAEAVEADDPLLFEEYLAWVKVLFANLGFPERVLPTTLDCLRWVLSERLPAAEKEAALAIVDAAAAKLDGAPLTIPPFIEGGEPLDELARQFLDALLQAERRAASRLILEAVQNGVAITDIYLQVFQRTQWEIGRLWQLNQISVAEEHFCTAATQMIMSQLYPYIFTGERKERSAVIACVGKELHEIGAYMVADFLEMNGWNTYFLGANTPPSDILQAVAERQANILALSATMTFHVSDVADIISRLRAQTSLATGVLIGGYPFNLSPDLWRKVGADGYAVDAAMAVTVADQIMAKNNNILIVGSEDGLVARELYEEMAPGNSEQAGRARPSLKEQLPGNNLCNELSYLNNELIAMQREIAKKNAELEQLNREKNYFLGMAAHDLRNPLHIVLGYSDFLMATCDDPAQQEMLQIIHKTSQFMVRLVDDLLSVSKIEAGELQLTYEPVNLAGLIRQSVATNRPLAAAKQIEIIHRLDDTLPAALVDSVKIEQALNNLLGNAIKFSEPESEIVVSLFQTDNNFLLSVQDEGPGISPEQQSRLFQPFQRGLTGARGETSTGLGLVIVKRIVEGHGGRIWFESELGRGSTFFISIPLSRQPLG